MGADEAYNTDGTSEIKACGVRTSTLRETVWQVLSKVSEMGRKQETVDDSGVIGSSEARDFSHG